MIGDNHLDPSVRAAQHLASNCYMSLSTADASGRLWASAVAYVATENAELLFSSAVVSTHARNIRLRPLIAAAIYDSRAPLGTADGAQLIGHCSVVSTACLLEELGPLFIAGRVLQCQDSLGSASTADPVERWSDNSPKRLFRLTIEEIWVLDLENYRVSEIDQRVSADISDVRKVLKNQKRRGG